jgi:hypothetical protein
MGKAKRRKQLDLNYGKKQPVQITIKKKVSPLTAKEGYWYKLTQKLKLLQLRYSPPFP